MTYRHPQGTSLGNFPPPSFYENLDDDRLRPGDFTQTHGEFYRVVSIVDGMVSLSRVSPDCKPLRVAMDQRWIPC